MTSFREYTSDFLAIQLRYLYLKTSHQLPSQNFPKAIFQLATGIVKDFESRLSLVFISKTKSAILYIRIRESGKP